MTTSNRYGDVATDGMNSGRMGASQIGQEIQIDLTACSRTLHNFNASVDSVEDISGRYHSNQANEIKEKGSPAFARSINDDDLTVSVTDDDPYNKSSYRGT